MIQGSCQCGRVRYEIAGSPREMYYCHCGMCRKSTGSSFATNMLVAAADFRIVAGGSFVKAYESSPGEHRRFCAECGSPLYSSTKQRPDRVSIRCGTLDADPGTRPSYHIYTQFKAPWYTIRDELTQFATDEGRPA